MAFSQKLFSSYHGYNDPDTRIGELNRIWYDSINNCFRIQLDNTTPGGTIIGAGGAGGSYVLPTATPTILGGVKIGSNITITNGVISVAAPFSGSYLDLTNKPTIPTVPTNVSAFTNDSGYITTGSLSVTTSNASGGGSLSYSNGVFTFNPADVSNVTSIPAATFEPMGHADKTQSTISFNNTTRTFTISPVGASYDVWVHGVKFTISTNRTVTIPNTTGLYYIYFDTTGTLTYQTSLFDFPTECMTAYIYWNSVTASAPFVADERHGITLDWATHEYLHRTRGAAIANGFGASNYILNGDGSNINQLQLNIASGTFFDEDLRVDVVSTATPTANTWQQDLTGASKIPMFYLSGSGWVMDAGTTQPVKQGTTYPTYNLNTAGTWTTPDIANGKYGITYIIATNNINYPVMGILGQNSYLTQNEADADTWANLTLTGFPIVEFRPLYKLVYQCRSNFTNADKSNLTAVWDLRSFNSVVQAAASYVDANALSGTTLAPGVVNSSLTSVGTLTTGTWQATPIANTYLANSSITVNGTAISLGGSGTVSANAGTLTGTTLAGGVVNSSLTNVGTLTSLNVTSTNTSASSVVSIQGVVSVPHGSTATWQFQTEGSNLGSYNSRIQFPDGTFQYTAWTNSITSGQVTTALGYTPYNATNPNGYISSTNSLVNGSFTASLTSVGQLQLPVITQSTYTGGTLVATGNILMNANGNVWQFGSDGTMSSPYSVGILTTGFKIPATGAGSVSLVAAATASAFTATFPATTGTVITSGDTGTVTNTMLAGSIANAKLTNSSVTVNGTAISLGGSGTVTAAAGTLTGATLNATVTASSLISVGTLTQTNFNFSGTGAVVQISGNGTQGGTTYMDFIKATNTIGGATNPNKWFRIDNTGKLEIINSAYTSSLWSLTDAGVMSTGQVQINGKKAVNGPAFRAYVATGQTITSGSQQKVTFGSTTFDTDSMFANSRFTPLVEGYYQFNATVRIAGSSGTGEVMIVLYKNGAEYARGANEGGTEQGANWYSLQVSDIAYANGSTDYFEIYFQQTSGSNHDITAGTAISHFSGVMVRGN